MAGAVKQHDMGNQVGVTIIDNDENIQSLLKREGIHAKMTKKSGDTIKAGIDMINAALRNTLESKDGGLKFYTGLRCNADPVLLTEKKPLSVITEMQNCVYDENKDKPVDGDDHGIDPLRYWFLYKLNKRKLDKPFHTTVKVSRDTTKS